MKVVSLSEICDLQNGFAFKSSDYVSHSNTLNCRMSNIRPDGKFDVEYAPKYLPDEFTKTYSNFLLKDGDIVIAMTDMANDPKILGVPTIVDTKGKKMLLNQRVGKLILLSENQIDIAYLQHSLNRTSVKKYYTQFAGGGLQLNVGKKEILSVKIPLPPLEQQKRIAAILDAADAYRQKTKALIAKYDELTQSLFLDMFGDPVTNPKGWEKKIGKEYSVKISVGVVIQPSSYYVENGVIALRAMNIRPNKIINNGFVYFSQINHSTILNKSIIHTNDVLIVRTGSTGTATVVPEEYNNCNCIDSIITRPNNKVVNPFYLAYFFNSQRGKELVAKNEVGGIQKHFNIGTLNHLKIPIPPINLQNQFAERVQAIEEQKAQAQASLEKAEELFNSLLQRAFKGELV